MKVEIKTRIEVIENGEMPKRYKKTKVGIVPEGLGIFNGFMVNLIRRQEV